MHGWVKRRREGVSIDFSVHGAVHIARFVHCPLILITVFFFFPSRSAVGGRVEA